MSSGQTNVRGKKKKTLFARGIHTKCGGGRLQETGAVFRFSKVFEVFNLANLKFEKS
jgi:hypothetical protein